jgi:predicted ATP-grasp superfamily ATP-dependent carboligase
MQSLPAERYVIAPSAEFLNIFLLKNRKYVESMGIELPLPDLPTYKQLSDKQQFAALCAKQDIPVPAEIDPRYIDGALPLVAKPKADITPGGQRVTPEIIKSQSDLKRFRRSNDASLYFYQEYIKGPSYYFLTYRHSDGHTDTFSQRNLLQQPNGKSIVLAEAANLHLTPVISPYLGILTDLDFRGLAMFEVKEQGGRYFMIEANPRMWGPAQLMADAGNNLFNSFINDYAETSFPWREECRSTLYAWFGGMAQVVERGEKLDSYAKSDEVIETLRSDSLEDIFGRSDTAAAFRSDKFGLSSNNIREVV